MHNLKGPFFLFFACQVVKVLFWVFWDRNNEFCRQCGPYWRLWWRCTLPSSGFHIQTIPPNSCHALKTRMQFLWRWRWNYCAYCCTACGAIETSDAFTKYRRVNQRHVWWWRVAWGTLSDRCSRLWSLTKPNNGSESLSTKYLSTFAR